MALVDTIESTKWFKKERKDGTFFPMLHWKELMQTILISLQEKQIIIDLNMLDILIESKKNSRDYDDLKEALKKYRENINLLSDWTYCKTSCTNNVITIDLPND